MTAVRRALYNRKWEVVRAEFRRRLLDGAVGVGGNVGGLGG
jgi:hypothetical protein